MSEIYKRGEIYNTDFGVGLGSEQMGVRPALIVQNNAGNFYSPTVIVAAITSQKQNKTVLPTHYIVGTDTGLNVPSIILLEQLRTVSKERLGNYIGELSPHDMKRLAYPLSVSLGMIRYQRKNLVLTLCKKCAEISARRSMCSIRWETIAIKKPVCAVTIIPVMTMRSFRLWGNDNGL